VKLNITIDNKTYEVEVEASDPDAPTATAPLHGYPMQPTPVRVPAAAPAAAPAPAKPAETTPVNESKVCRSPVSGIVVRAAAQVGQTLQVGDVLLILEAMKMETSITSPVAGKVAAIKVGPGDSVQSGQVVVEFE
jgi:methylmalonyl-CoA carboxyltransferase small subunit